MYVSPQDYLDPLTMGSNFASGLAGDLTGNPTGSGSLLGSTQGDNVSRFQPPSISNELQGATSALSQMPGFSMFAPLLSGIGSMLSSLGNLLSGNGLGAGTTQGSPQQGQQQFFGNATASSTGDPHLAFNGTNENGATTNAKWNSMSSHRDLLGSDSFAGGYRVSTNTTTPNSSGVTYNQSASVTTSAGADSVSLDNQGNATITGNGQSSSIADGQSFSLGNGETVSRAQNGTLTINDNNGNGGSIATTLSENGNGVDVNVQAANVDLGGALAEGPNAQTPGAQTAWAPQPYAQPQPGNYSTRRYTMDEAPMDIGAME